MKDKKFISVIWGYHKQIFAFEKSQNYHMHSIQVMKDAGYKCEIFSIDSQVKIEKDPNFIQGVTVIYYKNIFQYLLYLLQNRKDIIYSNSITIKTLLVGIIGKKTVFCPHSYPFGSSRIKRKIIILFYKYFSRLRVNNIDEYREVNMIKAELAYICPLSISEKFLDRSKNVRSGACFIGNLTDVKNPQILISTMQLLRKKHNDFILHIIGEDRYNLDGKNFLNLLQKHQLEECIILHGYLKPKEIYDVLQKTLIYINTSKSEGQCLAAYEAALAGNILCLPNILSFPSVFGEKALYHNDVKELVKNIEKIINNPKDFQLGIEQNQNMILEEYNYSKVSKKILNMFINL